MVRTEGLIKMAVCFHDMGPGFLGYSESGIRVRGVPVAIEVSPVRIRPEPGDRL